MRCRSLTAFLLIVAASPLGTAADTLPTWDISRTTSPKDVKELKSLQETVKTMVERVTPSTIAVFYQAGAGSGVIISEDGLVLTAAHVVSPSILGGRGGRNADAPIPKNVSLQLADGTRVRGVVLGRNGSMDSAMVRITDPVPKNAKWPGAEQGKWPATPVGKSEELKKGQWVVALGHPGGPKQGRRAPVRLGQMVSVGTTSRRIKSDCTLVGGDSGGPLFDLAGNLIGIHSSIGNDLTDNFHIPSHAFKKEWKQLLRGDMIGIRSAAWMGIVLAGDDDKERAKAKPVIEDVRPGSPAENAGLKARDLIIEFKGEKVDTTEDIDQMMAGTRNGERVLVKVQRGDETYEVEVTLGRRPKE